MTKQEFENEKMIIVCVGKLFSDQSTYLLGLLNHQPKYEFNLAIKSVDRFIKTIETKLTPEDNVKLQTLTDALNNGLAEFRA